MVKHIILWTLNPELSDDQKKAVKAGIKEGLEGLVGKVPGLIDVKILQAGIGVAMGNATPELKQHADYITTSVDKDGILNALQHFNLTQRGRLTMRHLLKNDAK